MLDTKAVHISSIHMDIEQIKFSRVVNLPVSSSLGISKIYHELMALIMLKGPAEPVARDAVAHPVHFLAEVLLQGNPN